MGRPTYMKRRACRAVYTDPERGVAHLEGSLVGPGTLKEPRRVPGLIQQGPVPYVAKLSDNRGDSQCNLRRWLEWGNYMRDTSRQSFCFILHRPSGRGLLRPRGRRRLASGLGGID